MVRVWITTGVEDSDTHLGIQRELGRAKIFHSDLWYVVTSLKGKELQMVFWQSDQRIVPLKQGNVCGGKALTGRPLEGDTTASLRPGVRLSTKPKPVTCLDSKQGGFSEEPYAGNPHVRFCEGH